MIASRLILVADDARLIGSIQAQIKKAFGKEISHLGLDAIRGRLTNQTNVLLLLAAGSPVDSDRILRLVQEIYLQKLPPVLVILEAGTPGPGRGLAGLDPYVAYRLRWPEQAGCLMQFLADRRLARLDLFGQVEDVLEDAIAARLVAQTPSLLPLIDRIALAAEHDVTVLLTGETGTGKTHLARLLHDCSPRAHHPFLAVPCGAIPACLVESAFFGHVKGAFTGATERKMGKFEAAGEGTILLDEIDTLPLEQQASLLRVIESGEYEAVGGNETKLCRARIIVASNWDLDEAVRQNRFRQDLYYRLNVMSFHLPPLRERVQDIAPLARAMAARFNTRFKKDLFDIHPHALDVLENHPWPGNIRQMENAIQQAVLVSRGCELLGDHLPSQIRELQPRTAVRQVPVRSDTLKTNREAHERGVILKALTENGFNRSRTAAALDISRVTLYKKMRAYGLFDSSPDNGEP
jgi:transcriptional regulator with PAS, ATPase and Fis domain